MTKARVDQPATADDLSEAARAVVRDAGDPRIDAHLRALGLAPDPTDAPSETARPEAAESPDLVVLRARVAELETALAASAGRVRWLVAALAVALVALAVLAVLLLAGAG